MTVKIQSVHFDADKKLLDFIQERVDKLICSQKNNVKALKKL
ncbi:MAG: hypothetical protein K0S44_2933 [Bacteroidetes bacterium]|nr:hypothetical protein [Bacteroidota bacterium]